MPEYLPINEGTIGTPKSTLPAEEPITRPKPKVFITGAAGFIGGHLMHYLQKNGYTVTGIDNFMHASDNPIKKHVEYGDVRYQYDMKKGVEWADVVIHCAAQIHVDKSIQNPQETIDINVVGTLNVLELCRKYGKKMIFASTSEVYGTSQTPKMDELHPLDAQSPYGASKVAGDRLCKSYRDSYGLPVTILRNFNTFGPYQANGSYGAVISIFVDRVIRNQPPVIYGTGEQERDYMYIDDAVKAYELCITNDIDVMNAGTGKTVSINQLARKIIKICNKENLEPIHGDPRPGEVQRLCAGIKKAKKFGFTPTTNLDAHLTSYINWYIETYVKHEDTLLQERRDARRVEGVSEAIG